MDSTQQIQTLVVPRTSDLGDGFMVRRALPSPACRMVGPFVFFDEMGPVILADGKGLDVRPHPHIGLATVTYLFAGEILHRDSLGTVQPIRPAEVNWMTAGRGIAHSERFEDPAALAGGALEMIQTWVALPEKDEEAMPSFNNYSASELPIFTENGVWMRLIAGDAYGLINGVNTHSPLFYLHVMLKPGARFGLPKEHSERGFYIAKGSVEIAGNSYREGQMLVFTKGVDPIILAKEATNLMLLGGEPLGERFIWWNFVSSRKERIEQAKEDWKQGRILLPPTDNHEFIPLPDDRSKPAGSTPPAPEPLS